MKSIISFVIEGLGKSSLVLFSGSALSQVLNFIAIPVLARIFTPEHFGVVATISSISAILLVISSGRYQLAIPLPKNFLDGFSILILCIAVSLAFNLFILLAIVFVKAYVFSSINLLYVIVIPLMTFLSAVINAFTFWYTREKHFKTIFWGRIILAAMTICSQLVLSMIWGASAGIFFSGIFIGTVSAIIFFCINIIADRTKWNFSIESLTQNALRYKRFPLVEIWGALLNTISGNFPNLFLTNYWSVWHVGQYSMMQKLIIAPSGAFSTSVSQVFFGKISEAKNKGEKIYLESKRIYKLLFFIGLVPFALISIGGKNIFSILLGDQWAVSGVFSQVLSVGFLFQFAYQPLGFLLIVLEKQSLLVWMNTLFLLLTIISFCLGYLLDSQDLMISLILLSLSYSFIYVLFSKLILNVVKNTSLNI